MRLHDFVFLQYLDVDEEFYSEEFTGKDFSINSLLLLG
jgi:hypothetical protein